MASASNRVVAGDYVGRKVESSLGTFLYLLQNNSWKDFITLDKVTLESYEVITDEHRKSAASGIKRGLVGGILLGPVGMLAGGLSAKNKGIYQVAIEFKDGKRSLIEIDDKKYKILVKQMF